MPHVRTKTIERRSPGAFETYKATAASTIEAGDVVRVTGTSSGGAYYIVQKAQTGQVGKLMVATVKSNDGYLLVANSDVLSLDTSAASLGDPVYLSESTPGALTLTPTQETVGWVTAVATDGAVLIDPASAADGVSPWIDISGDLVAALQAFSTFTPEYRVVGDRVELRGIVEVITGTQTFPYTLFSNFPGAGGTIPAGLEPGTGSHIVPVLFSDDTFVTSFPGQISAGNKVTVSGTGGTGVATAWDVVILDGISWSTTA